MERPTQRARSSWPSRVTPPSSFWSPQDQNIDSSIGFAAQPKTRELWASSTNELILLTIASWEQQSRSILKQNHQQIKTLRNSKQTQPRRQQDTLQLVFFKQASYILQNLEEDSNFKLLYSRRLKLSWAIKTKLTTNKDNSSSNR